MLSNLLIIFHMQLLEVCGMLMFDTAADACIGQNQTKKNPDVSVRLVRFFYWLSSLHSNLTSATLGTGSGWYVHLRTRVCRF